MYRIELQDDRGGAGGWTLVIRDGDNVICNGRATSWVQAIAYVFQHIEVQEERRK